jgi:hypothetical protein
MKKVITIVLVLTTVLTLELVQSAPAAADSAVLEYDSHYYQYITTPVTWLSARATAALMTYSTGSDTYYGHLATINSEGEQNFVYNSFLKDALGLGNDGRGWLGGFQLKDQPTTDAGWYWLTGESISGSAYINWDTSWDSPNDFNAPDWTEGVEDNEENRMEMRAGGFWDDLDANTSQYPYLVEFEPEGLVANGSFERPAASLEYFSTFTNGTTGLGWNVSPATPGLEIQTIGIDVSEFAVAGTQWAELASDANNQIWQDVPTFPGQPYLLSFACAQRPLCGNDNTQVKVEWNGQPIFTSAFSDPYPETITWVYESFVVWGVPGTSTELRFTQLGPDDGLGTLLDDVSLEPLPLTQFVNAGGSLKGPDKISFSGIVGQYDGSIGGWFQIVTHGKKGATTTWTCVNDFSSLDFVGDEIDGPQGPDADANTTEFTGMFTPNNGAPAQEFTVTLIDLSEGGAKQDEIGISSTPVSFENETIDTGNIQIHYTE